ncbi:MAG: hypothetical protein DRJ40_00240 [Thermoprotei archaeon]|nr:MAG: hypothetical protein DRJ40_00240 [Thermoprotei archaeon]
MSRLKIYLLGHSHIDVAWLWSTNETKVVCHDTFLNVIKLMERFPDFKYAQSTALYYRWIEEQYPELLERIRKLINRGQWEVVGGSWVECDCIVVSGESLVRQFVYGKKYLREKLGVDVEVAWFPDSFGFPSILPQILKKCGIKYFFTQKLNWNDIVLYPYNAFWWESSDGSRVLVYNPLLWFWTRLWDMDLWRTFINLSLARQELSELLLLYGYGDHGGGPTSDMVQYVLEKLPSELSKLGVVETSHIRAIDYFRMLEESYGATLPTYRGELYLQFHRGVFSSQVKVKELIKRCEYLLEVLEKLYTIRYLVTNRVYSREEVQKLWLELLTAQFHDVASGTLSETPYWEFRRSLEHLEKELHNKVCEVLLELVARSLKSGNVTTLVVFNPVPRCRRVYVYVPSGYGLQSVRDIVSSEALDLVAVDVHGFEIAAIPLTELRNLDVHTDLRVMENEREVALENSYVRITVDRLSGRVKQLYSKVLGFEYLAGRGIRLELYDDKPTLGRATIGTVEKFVDYYYDCWEVYALQSTDGVKFVELNNPLRVEVIERGPLRATVLVEYEYRDESGNEAHVRHYIRLYSNEPWIEGVLDIDWKCCHKMLKLCLDLSFWSEYVRVGEPYGSVLRRNPASPYSTLYDRAKWEAPFNTWIDYSDGEKGLAVICGTRFSYDLMVQTLRLTILRAPRYPPDGWRTPWTKEVLEAQKVVEQERHIVTYYLYPHRGNYEEGEVPTVAENLTKEPITYLYPGTGKALRLTTLKVEPTMIQVPALKLSESRDTITVRLVNPYEHEIDVEIELLNHDIALVNARELNLLEEPIEEIKDLARDRVRTTLIKHEIKTIELEVQHKERT